MSEEQVQYVQSSFSGWQDELKSLPKESPFRAVNDDLLAKSPAEIVRLFNFGYSAEIYCGWNYVDIDFKRNSEGEDEIFSFYYAI